MVAGTRNNGGNGARSAIQDATILVVDDNVALLRSIEQLLCLEGYTVWLARHGSEGLEQLEAATGMPDLIISDIAMPVMDGFEFYQAVRERNEWIRIPFVFLTARDQIGDLQTGYALGADDYLIKPLDQDRLLMIVRSKIERSRELMRYIDLQRQALATVQRELSLMVAHELRTPLVSITMVSDMLAREFEQLDALQVHDMLDMMRSGSVRMQRLVEQMVLYVQLQSGGLEDDVRKLAQRVTIDELLQSALRKARQWDYRGREVAVDLTCDTPGVTVEVERMALSHAIAEVLYNAMMFARPGTAITLRQHCERDVLQVLVADEGLGIPQEQQARVFEPFYQVDRAQFEQQGIGIGLTLARRIVEAHGGGVTLDAEPGQGTRVTLRMPVIVGAV